MTTTPRERRTYIAQWRDGVYRVDTLDSTWTSDDGDNWTNEDGEPVTDHEFTFSEITFSDGPRCGETVG